MNSWDGFDIAHTFLDPTAVFQRDKIRGKYWIDIFNTALGERVIQIQGAFNDAEPYMFQGQASWYGSRYYVMPVGGTLWTGEFGLRRLLICDVEAATRQGNESGLKQRK